jgi:hypothetical protein
MSEFNSSDFKTSQLQIFKLGSIVAAILAVACIVIIILMGLDVIPVSDMQWVYVFPAYLLINSCAALGFCIYKYRELSE